MSEPSRPQSMSEPVSQAAPDLEVDPQMDPQMNVEEQRAALHRLRQLESALRAQLDGIRTQ